MSAPAAPRQSRRGHQNALLRARIAELEGRLAVQSDATQQQKQEVSEKARKVLLQPDGTLSFLYFCGPSGKRGAVLQISCMVSGLPLLRTALSVDGKDFATVYTRAVHLIAEAYGVSEDDVLIRDMLATSEAFLRLKGLRLVEVKYHQVLPAERA